MSYQPYPPAPGRVTPSAEACDPHPRAGRFFTLLAAAGLGAGILAPGCARRESDAELRVTYYFKPG